MPGKNEVVVLRDQITAEVNRDSVVIGNQLFGSEPSPDLARQTDEQLRAAYRQKYLDQDRGWLQGEARRDPQQFMRIARQIGVVLPNEMPTLQPPPGMLPLGQPAPAQAAPAAPQALPPPVGPAGPVDPSLALQALQQVLAGPSGAPAQVAAPPPGPVAPMVGPQPGLPPPPQV